MEKRLYIVRHGKAKSAGIASYGEGPGLSEEGISSARSLARNLEVRDSTLLVASPKARAIQTVEEIARASGVSEPIVTISRLLDFYAFDSPYRALGLKAYKEGRYIPFLVCQSDEEAKRCGDSKSITYEKAVKAMETFTKLWLTHYPDTTVAGTHLGLVESLLAKKIGETQGERKKRDFVEEFREGLSYAEAVELIKDNGWIISNFRGREISWKA